MKRRSKLPAVYVMSAAAVFVGLAGSVEAETTTYHCKGVNYVYDAGIGKGRAGRISASRTFLLDPQAMTAELANGEEVRTASLEKDNFGYRGFLPGKTRVFGATVLGEAVVFDPGFLSLELSYELEDGRHFLSFTGHCRP